MSLLRSDRKRVVIVDDSRTMRAVLEQMLVSRLGCEIVGVAESGEAALSVIRRLKPDLVTIDIAMPSMDGKQLLGQLEEYPDLCKVVISAAACNNVALKATLERLGADACLCKTDLSRDPDELCRTLSSLLHVPRRIRTTIAATSKPAGVPLVGYPVPTDERQRLAALERLELTNDRVDRRLDLLTEHLANTTSFSACILTFIDQTKQWVKSGCGMEPCSMPRSQAICNYTLCGDEPFIVHDARMDARFAKLDVVRSGVIRSYVGYPIVGASGVHLGAICLIDTKPRRVSVKEITNLRSIARIAAELIERCAPAETAGLAEQSTLRRQLAA